MSSPADRQRLAVLVHEVRSPVAALAALAEASRHERLETAERRSLAYLAAAACRAIERVVADAAVASVRREDVDLGRLATEAAKVASVRGIAVEAVVDVALPTVSADPQRIRQALDNLIVNAHTHARSEEPVVVRATLAGRELLLSVSDSGVGIPLEDQARVFEPGVRLFPLQPGSGLGLALVLRIAEAHGAELRLESAPGEGSRFVLAFPLH